MKVFLLILLAALGFVFVKKPQEKSAFVSPIAALATVPKEVEVKNLDGKKKLILVDNAVYVDEGAGRRFFYSGENISLPQNAWAPNDAYVFIKQGGTFLVFKTTSGEQLADIAALFAEKLPDRVFGDATGWDGVGLVHVTSDGPSYWFDVASTSFLQLAH